MTITAQISYDRGTMMSGFGGGRGEGEFDKDAFADMMGGQSSLTLEEYELYADAESVKDFYYTLTAYFNGSDEFMPVSDESSDESEEAEESETDMSSGFPGGMGGMMGGFGASGDFTIVGYSSDAAMTAFVEGNASVVDGGTMFEEGTEELYCLISAELALYNNLSVGDTIIITNPSLETETYTLTICGFYESSATNDFSMSMFGASQDPANQIYMSANALQVILDASEAATTTVTDENTGREKESTVTGSILPAIFPSMRTA